MNGYVRELSEKDRLHNEILSTRRFLEMFPNNPWYRNRLADLESKLDALLIWEDLRWLEIIEYQDLTDLSFGSHDLEYKSIDLSKGSTQKWWDSLDEVPF